jgi:hypothetical protein
MRGFAKCKDLRDQFTMLSGMCLATLGPALTLSLADQCMLALPLTIVMVFGGSMLGLYRYKRRSRKPEIITLVLTDERKFYHQQPARKAA